MSHFKQHRFKRYIHFLVLICGMIYFISSCKRDDQRAQWDTEIITPLLKSSLGIKDLLNDTSISANADSSIKLVYQNHLYDVSLDSLFRFFDTSVTKVYNIDSISLLDQHIVYSVSLGYLYPALGSQNGTSTIIPPFTFPSTPDTTINVDSLFQTMTLVTGYIDIAITNGFPVPITNLIFLLKDSITGVYLAQDTFALIPPNTTATKTVSLAGKTVNSKLTARIVSMNTPGSGFTPVLIDTSDALTADLRIHDLHPSYATAIFPTQNLVDKAQAFKFDLGKVQLKEAVVKKGAIVINLYSTLQDSVHFTYSLPNATKNGNQFIVTRTLPPAPPGGISSFSNSYDFTDYHLDMRGDLSISQDTVNTMYNVFQARVDSTGQMKTLSLNDSIYANIGFQGVTPAYGRGYLGQDTFNFGPASLYIDMFKNINANNFQLQDVKMSIDVENNIGADGTVFIQNMRSVNTRNNITVPLTGAILSSPILIPRAIDPGGFNAVPAIPAVTSYVLNGSNSNAPAFVSNLPNRIDYSLELQTNPLGNVSVFNDFVYSDKLMRFDLNLEIPLSFVADDLTLFDTVNVSVNAVDLSRITGGTLTLIADNGFPFDATVQMFMLDKFNNVTDSLFANTIITAAPVNANGKVTVKKKSKLIIPVTQERIYRFLHETPRMKVISHFTTKPTGQTIKIYSDYRLDLQLTGDFNYRTN